MSQKKKRRLDPELWNDLALGLASHDAQLLFVKLITQADDDGRLIGRVGWIRSQCYPLEDDLEAGEIGAWLDELDCAGLISRYEHAGQPFIALPRWNDHQWIDQRYYKASKLPPPPDLGGTGEPHEEHRSDSGGTHEQHMSKGSKAKVEKKPEALATAKASGAKTTKKEKKGRTAKRSELPTGGALSDLLVELVTENDPDGKRPTITPRWLYEEQKLVEIDGRDPEQIAKVILWVQADDFESPNVLSMPKLRERYDHLLRKALAAQGRRPKGSSNGSALPAPAGERKAAA